MRSRPTRRLVAVTALAALLTAVPVGVLASHQFADVPDSSSYHGDIDAIADAGITTGCGGGNYCPKAYVTREQMAAFMNRLGALGAGKTPVVNADKLDGKDSTEFLSTTDAIVMGYFGPYLPESGDTVTLGQYADVTFVFASGTTGVRSVIVPMPGPMAIGGTSYGLQSAKLCWYDASSVTIDMTLFGHADSYYAEMASDASAFSATTANCHTLTDSDVTSLNKGAASLKLDINFSATDGTLPLVSITGTWIPLP